MRRRASLGIWIIVELYESILRNTYWNSIFYQRCWVFHVYWVLGKWFMCLYLELLSQFRNQNTNMEKRVYSSNDDSSPWFYMNLFMLQHLGYGLLKLNFVTGNIQPSTQHWPLYLTLNLYLKIKRTELAVQKNANVLEYNCIASWPL
jgi:hypothetical protein